MSQRTRLALSKVCPWGWGEGVRAAMQISRPHSRLPGGIREQHHFDRFFRYTDSPPPQCKNQSYFYTPAMRKTKMKLRKIISLTIAS